MTGARAAFLLLNGGAILAAGLLAVAAHGTRVTSLLWLAALSGYLVVIHSTVLTAGVAARLSPAGVGSVLLVALVVAAWCFRRRRPPPEAARAPAPPFTPLSLYPVLVAVLAGAVWLSPHLLDATRLWIWDDYTYHMVYPAIWLVDGMVAAVEHQRAFTMQAWYPLSADLVSTWFMVPFASARADALAWVSLTGALYAGMVVAGSAELLRRLGGRPGAWAIAAVAFATSHRTAVMASSFSDADLAQAATLFAALVFATPRGAHERWADVRADLGYAAVLTGVALGIKVTSAVPSLVVLTMLALRARHHWPLRAALARIALVLGAAWTATGAYWYARNALRTGNAVYPGRFLGWAGTTFPETTLVEYFQRYGVAKTVADAVAIYSGWPLLHALLALAGLVGLAAWWLGRRRDASAPARYFAAGALAIAVSTALLLPATPFSAGNALTFRSGFVHWDSMRFVGLLALLGWASLALVLDAGAGASRSRLVAAAAIATACLLTSGDARLAAPVTLAAIAAAALATATAAAPVRRIAARAAHALAPPVRRALAPSAALLAIAGLLVWHHDAKAVATAASIHREVLFGPAAAALDAQPAGSRVAVFGDQWVYPAFGARHHLVPVRVDGDGRVAAAPIADAMRHGPLTVTPGALLENLRASRIDVVVVLHLPHPGRPPDWPEQHYALEATGAARLLVRHSCGAVWSLR